jgi:hypothetical protein
LNESYSLFSGFSQQIAIYCHRRRRHGAPGEGLETSPQVQAALDLETEIAWHALLSRNSSLLFRDSRLADSIRTH